MIRFQVLGPVAVMMNGQQLPLGGRKQRAVLAILLLNANRVVPVSQILAGVWGERASHGATNTVHVYISNLRSVLEPDRVGSPECRWLVTQKPGYSIRVTEDHLDLLEFLATADEARRLLEENCYKEAAARLNQALALWRGPALADLVDEPFAQVELAALEESRLAALEARFDAEFALDRAGSMIGELGTLVAKYPLRERFRGLLMEALYRSGRQADALEVYRATRTMLAEELGVDPSPELRELERAILAQEKLGQLTRHARPFLLFHDGGGHQQVIALDAHGSPLAIGRKSANDLCLGWDPEVSRVHAQLERTSEGWTLVDDGQSRNGSYVNGERVIGRRALRDAEVIRLGSTVLLYRSSGAVPSRTLRESDLTAAASISRAFEIDVDDRVLLNTLTQAMDPSHHTPASVDQAVAEATGRTVADVAAALESLRHRFDVADLPVHERDARLLQRARVMELLTDRAN